MAQIFYSVEKFLEFYYKNQDIFNSYCSIDLLIREERKVESNGINPQTGNRIRNGSDIHVYTDSNETNVYIFGDVNFEGGQRIEENMTLEALYRKNLYDFLMGYPNSHKLDIWSPGKRGSPYEKDTPFIEINKTNPSIINYSFNNRFRQKLIILSNFIKIIDSREYEELMMGEAKRITMNVEGLTKIIV